MATTMIAAVYNTCIKAIMYRMKRLVSGKSDLEVVSRESNSTAPEICTLRCMQKAYRLSASALHNGKAVGRPPGGIQELDMLSGSGSGWNVAQTMVRGDPAEVFWDHLQQEFSVS